MSTAPAEESRRRLPWGSLLLCLLLLWFVGSRCDWWGGDEPSRPSADPDAAPAAEAALQSVLAARTEALAANDEQAWLSLVGEDTDYRDRQQWLFENLGELQLQVATFTLVDGSAEVDTSGDVWAQVRRELQVAGFDERPVATIATYRFHPVQQATTADPGAPVTGGVTGGAQATTTYVLIDDEETSAPWDLAPIAAVRSGGALLIADADDAGAAALAGEVDDAIDGVADEVPFAWSAQAMVYALDDLDVLAAIDDLPGDPDDLDGVAFPVWSEPAAEEEDAATGGGEATQQRQIAAIRVVLHPRALDGRLDRTERTRLLRHELTHVALGDRDDHVPRWLAEGIAEYVSVRGIDASQRVISGAAVQAAEDDDIRTLPSDDDFGGATSGASYGISWYACEFIAATYGQDALWSLLDAYAATPDEDHDGLLVARLGIDEQAVAQGAADQIAATFG